MGYCFGAGSYSPIAAGFDNGDCLSLERASLDGRSRLWQWSWGWIGAKKACLCGGICTGDQDLINLGCAKINWRHLFWKLKAELRKMMDSRPTQRFKYDALSYAQNFDDGCWQDPDVHSFACRFSAKAGPHETCKPCS